MRDLHGLAPGGVCRASIITDGAVVSYTTFSPFSYPDKRNRMCIFCDTFRSRGVLPARPSVNPRRLTLWCSDFPPRSALQRNRAAALPTIPADEWLIKL